MRHLYNSQIEIAKNLPSSSEQLSYLNSILRSILQVASITSLEAVRELTPFSPNDVNIDQFIRRFEQPSDGLPIEALDTLIPIIRSHVSKNYMIGWFENSDSTPQPLAKTLMSWVEFRNKKPGHGVVDKNDADIWSEKLHHLTLQVLDMFGSALPQKTDQGTLRVEIGDSDFILNTPLIYCDKPIVVNKVTSRKGVWKLYAQSLDWSSATEVTVNLGEKTIFAIDDGFETTRFHLREISVEAGGSSIFHNIPVRQTDIFEGRRDELLSLEEWINEAEDSRFCLIYGDGGFGKTTLVLEFLNRLLEGDVKTTKKLPSIICYHTAKMTRWTDTGIVHLKGISDAMEDGVRELLYCLSPVLNKDWFKVAGISLIDKVTGEFTEQGFNRDDILLVIDNTETLATSPSEVDELSRFLKQIGRKLGRVIITSRRREFLPATPIKISELPDDDALQLMIRLGKEYKAEAINKAGERRLRSVCKSLNKKPLLIDTLVKFIARSSTGIDDALDQILRKTSDELLEFLYQDAWLRMNELQRHVYLVLVVIAHPIDNLCVADTCQEIGIQHVEFQSSLDETYFANLTDYKGGYDMEIVDLAKQFFRQQLGRLPIEEKERINQIAAKVDYQASKREQIEREYKSDRVADAFRSQYAKAAKIASEKGDLSLAKESFELAILEEPMNAALKDRYAWFLLNRLQRPDEAKPIAEDSIKLDSSNADAFLTLSLICYRLGDIKAGDDAINLARKKGKAESLCYLRMGIARYHQSKKQQYSKDALVGLTEAEKLIELATKAEGQNSNYYQNKSMDEARKYLALISSLRYRINKGGFMSMGVP